MSVRDRVAIYLGKRSRSRALVLACSVSILCVSGCTEGARRDLREEFSTDLTITGAAPTSATHGLSAGTYLVEAREHEIDVRLMVDAGGKHSDLEDQVPRHGVIHQIVSLPAPGELRVQVRSSDHRSKLGRVHLRIVRFTRAANDPPGTLELGFAASAAAGEFTAVATPESWARAADKLHEAVAFFDAAHAGAERAQAAYSLANVQYAARDEWAAAVRATEIATDAYRDIDDAAGVHNAETVRAAAEIELAAGMNAGTQRAEQQALYAGADRRLEAAATYFAEHGLRIRAEYAVNMRAVRAVNIGDYVAGEQFLTQAVQMARANGDASEEARSLGNLAAIHTFRGQIAQAAQEYAALQPLVDRDTQPYEYAVLLGNFGFNLIALGDFDRALALQSEALDLYTKVGDEDERAAALSAIGSLYLRMGDAERALETLRAAIVAQERVSDAVGRASTLRVAGNAAAALGQHATALTYLRQSASIDSNPHGVARTSVLIAGELRAVGNLAEAEAALTKPLASTNALTRASALEERARLRIARHQKAPAIEDLRAADRQYAELGLEFNRIDTNTALSQALLSSGDATGASAAADEAISIVSRIRVKSGNPEWRARFLSARYSPYEARIAADFAAAKDGDAEAAWHGFRTAEQVRAQSLADELAVGPSDAVRVDPVDAELRARLTSQQMRLESRMQTQDAVDAATAALRESMEQTRAQIDLNRLRRQGVEARTKSLPDSLEQMQQKLPADAAVLAYFVGDEAGHAWLLTRRTLRHLALPPRAALERAVVAAIGEHRAGKIGSSADRQLGATLLGRLLDGVTEKRILLLADGPLNSVPFAALQIPGGGGELVVDRFVLGYAPSLALALQGRQPSGARGTRVAVVSDPVYAADDRRLHLAGGDVGTFRGPAQPSPNNLTRLPYSALEASAVTKALGSDDTIELAGFSATTQRVLELPSGELSVLHFATHAQARRDSPEQSALYLSEYASDGARLADSRLTASEIRRSGLRADVVVLSGCATGDGGELRGEGVLGLTYGFLANGSHSVVASLWPIEDASTARFMNEFYMAYRASGRTAEALRVAQMRTRASTVSAVWSSFVVRANEFP